MKIGKFDATGLFVVQRTRAWGNGNKTICIKPSGFYLGSQAYKALDLVNNKFVLFVKNIEDANRAEKLYLIAHSDESLASSSSKVTSSSTLSCMDVINSIPKLERLSKNKDRNSRQLKLEWDEEKLGHFIGLRPSLELECIDIRKLPDEKGIYSLKDHMGETTYIGQGNIKTRVTAHKNSKISFQKVCYSFVDDKDDRDLWESTLIEEFKNERGRLPYHNKQNGNNYSKLVAVDSISQHSVNEVA